jgi:hypothetical protein
MTALMLWRVTVVEKVLNAVAPPPHEKGLEV